MEFETEERDELVRLVEEAIAVANTPTSFFSRVGPPERTARLNALLAKLRRESLARDIAAAIESAGWQLSASRPYHIERRKDGWYVVHSDERVVLGPFSDPNAASKRPYEAPRIVEDRSQFVEEAIAVFKEIAEGIARGDVHAGDFFLSEKEKAALRKLLEDRSR